MAIEKPLSSLNLVILNKEETGRNLAMVWKGAEVLLDYTVLKGITEIIIMLLSIVKEADMWGCKESENNVKTSWKIIIQNTR